MTSAAAPADIRIGVAVSRFNREVTDGLLGGALSHLAEQGVDVGSDDIVDAPGAFELPLLAQAMVRTGRYDGVICLGCVVKGDTAHFEFISLGASLGLMTASLATETPISFGVLTTYTDDQADIRSQNDDANKGREAAGACLQAVAALRRIRGGREGPPPLV